MINFLETSVFFGVTISFLTYGLGILIQKKFKLALFNPLLISVVLIIIFLMATKIDYKSYEEGAKYISYFLTPATVCLAIPLYEKIEQLKKNYKAILMGILSGVITSLFSVFAMSYFFSLSHEEYVTLLPKSITNAIGMGVSEELGGYVALTVAIIFITGVIGNMFAKWFLKLINVTHPVAKGVAMGTSSHALGTSKAIEMGETEGAISGLSVGVAGVFTVIFVSFFSYLI
ncbi:MAG: LrgB family protein [Lachnospirales bacterium]